MILLAQFGCVVSLIAGQTQPFENQQGQDRFAFELARIRITDTTNPRLFPVLDLIDSKYEMLDYEHRLPDGSVLAAFASNLRTIDPASPHALSKLARFEDAFETVDLQYPPAPIVPPIRHAAPRPYFSQPLGGVSGRPAAAVNALAGGAPETPPTSIAPQAMGNQNMSNDHHRFIVTAAPVKSRFVPVRVMPKGQGAESFNYTVWCIKDEDFGSYAVDPLHVPASKHGTIFKLLKPGAYRFWAGPRQIAFLRTVFVKLNPDTSEIAGLEVPFTPEYP